MNILWSFSGAAARAIAHFRNAKVAMEYGIKPTIMIGNSSGALALPIIAVAYQDENLMNEAIKFAETLDLRDMFPYQKVAPFTKQENPTPAVILRGLSHNHLVWQDIKPLYKKVFTQRHFELFKKSDIKCYSFGVKGKNWTPIKYCLNDAKSLDDLIDMIECSSRIVPIVQPMNYKGEGHIDGGFISFQPAMWLFNDIKIKQLVSFYSDEVTIGIKNNDYWDKSILSITTQAMKGMPKILGFKDAIIEELYCKLNNIDYLRIEAPNGYTDEIYETDDEQLIALGKASEEKSIKIWSNYELGIYPESLLNINK